ncbi:hypothetical protein V6N13_064295 [Hibiscus sabdariffa]
MARQGRHDEGERRRLSKRSAAAHQHKVQPQPRSKQQRRGEEKAVALTQEHGGGGSTRAIAQGFPNVATHTSEHDGGNSGTRQIEAAALKMAHTTAVALARQPSDDRL